MTTPSDRVIERVAKIWAGMLKNPKFDNGDASFNGFFAQSMAEAGNDARTKDREEHDEKVDKFQQILADRLKFLRDNNGKEIPIAERVTTPWGSTPDKYYFRKSLDVDYDPDVELSEAAQQAGFANVSKTLFPWKTNISFYEDNICVSAGYAAPAVYHYPISEGRWLVCQLRGEDMPKIIEAVENGALTGFTVTD